MTNGGRRRGGGGWCGEEENHTIRLSRFTLPWRSNVGVARVGQNNTILYDAYPQLVGTALKANGNNHFGFSSPETGEMTHTVYSFLIYPMKRSISHTSTHKDLDKA